MNREEQKRINCQMAEEAGFKHTSCGHCAHKDVTCLPSVYAAKPTISCASYQPAEVKKEVKDPKQFGHPRFYEMLEAMADLHSRKNHDYAGTSDPLKNLRACKRLELRPFIGVMVRLQDKWSRLEEFVKSGKLMVKGESVKDTLMDNAVYSLLAIILYEEQEQQIDTSAETTSGYGGDVQNGDLGMKT